MKVTKTKSTRDETVFDVVATPAELASMKTHVLTHFQERVKVPGFRAGKIPASVLERNISSEQLQSEFMQEAVEQMYYKAVAELKLRTLDQPKITIKKFVPYDALEFEATVPVIGEIKLANYRQIKKKMPGVNIEADEIDKVIESLRLRMAEKNDVSRAAKNGDEIWIDFSGSDSKGQPVKGADGKDYPLQLGSKTFIPGFEDNLVDLKAGQEKEFTLTFPKDYQVKALAGKKVTFKVKVTKVQEVILPKADDEFAKKVGPFNSLKELRSDIKKQLSNERENQLRLQFESDVIRQISEESRLEVPKIMVDEQVERMLGELKQNLAYRGQTYGEFLKSESKTEAEYIEQTLAPEASQRVRASLVLSEIAEAEKVEVTNDELESRINQLKTQYQDAAMQAELAKPQARRDVAARILTEKTVARIMDIVSS